MKTLLIFNFVYEVEPPQPHSVASDHRAFGWMNKWMNEWMSEYMDEWMNEWMNERMNKWASERKEEPNECLPLGDWGGIQVTESCEAEGEITRGWGTASGVDSVVIVCDELLTVHPDDVHACAHTHAVHITWTCTGSQPVVDFLSYRPGVCCHYFSPGLRSPSQPKYVSHRPSTSTKLYRLMTEAHWW